MATSSVVRDGWLGNQRRVIVDATLSNSYTAGGEAISADDLDLDDIEDVVVMEGATTGGYVPRYDTATDQILLFEAGADGTPLDEVAAATDVSTETVRLEVRGRS